MENVTGMITLKLNEQVLLHCNTTTNFSCAMHSQKSAQGNIFRLIHIHVMSLRGAILLLSLEKNLVGFRYWVRVRKIERGYNFFPNYQLHTTQTSLRSEY